MSKDSKDVNPSISKSLPNSPELELGVVGAILKRPELIEDVVAIVEPSDFYNPMAKECFTSMKALYSQGEPVDLVSLYISLNAAGSQIASYQLSQFMEQAPVVSPANLAKKIKELSNRRNVIQAAICLYEEATDVSVEMTNAANEAAKLIDDVLAGRSVSGRQDLRDIVLAMVAKAESGERKRAILTPYEALNHITGGLHAGEMVTLAGRPGTGKTALALNIAASAMFASRKVGIFSLEMSQESLAERPCAATMSMDAQIFRTRKFTPGHLDQLREFTRYADGMTAKVFDTPRVDPDTMRAECRKWRRTQGLDLVVIDYLQLVQPGSTRKSDSREREVAEISRSVKQLAIELDIPIVLLAQLNRQIETRTDQTPKLSDLRESGSIEQDSDMVWFLSPWDTAKSDKDVVDVRLTVAKSRSSSTGQLMLQYVRRFLRSDEVA